MKLKRALLSVSDKRKLLVLVKCLKSHGIELISTGGTASFLRERNLKIKEVSDLTEFPEMMGGRVKTLHPIIHGGILYRRNNSEDLRDLKNHGISEIDLVIVNLYPFRAAVLSGKNHSDCLENIDVGGPALIRAAAKNYKHVCVIVDPKDYPDLMNEMNKNKGKTSASFRRKMAIKAFLTVSNYDYDIQSWLREDLAEKDIFRPNVRKEVKLRYGENPHQKAELLIFDQECSSIGAADQIQGKELSYNNYIDSDSAFKIISEFRKKNEFACVIVKHKNPCGVGKANTLQEAYKKAKSCDPISAFGGIIAVNSELDVLTAKLISKTFTEVIIAPRISIEAKAIFKDQKNVRLLETSGLLNQKSGKKVAREISGGILIQDENIIKFDDQKIESVTNLKPSKRQLDDLIFAWKIIRHVNSNAIIIAKNGQTIGIGNGQTSRLDSVKIAVMKSEILCKNRPSYLKGSVAASDAFFPFSDGVVELIKAGISAIIQPGGSINDEEIIDKANKEKISMLFTGIRYFSH